MSEPVYIGQFGAYMVFPASWDDEQVAAARQRVEAHRTQSLIEITADKGMDAYVVTNSEIIGPREIPGELNTVTVSSASIPQPLKFGWSDGAFAYEHSEDGRYKTLAWKLTLYRK